VRKFGFNKRILTTVPFLYEGLTELCASNASSQSCNLKQSITAILSNLQSHIQCVLLDGMSRCVAQSVLTVMFSCSNFKTYCLFAYVGTPVHHRRKN